MADYRSPTTADPRHNGSVGAQVPVLQPGQGLVAAVGRRVAVRLPAADLSERDPDYIRRTLPGLWLLASYYFRADVRGLHHVPEQGPVLLVGNHSGGNVPADTFVFTLAFSAYFGADRPFYQLAHNLVMVWPGLGFLRRYGTLAAAHENAARALDSGAAVLVYPGGDYETHRPSLESARVDFDHRHRFIALALERGLPIVPAVSIGGQETALFLARGERLAHALSLDRAFHLHVLPISLALWITDTLLSRRRPRHAQLVPVAALLAPVLRGISDH
jgi:1-acyl-sn-glycerol-3-phosphate acyltransferase